MKNAFLVSELIGSQEIKLQIPLFQRNFTWEHKEIDQLIIDILDSIKIGRKQYYIGTLVVSDSDKNDVLSIIDGQQRATALLLIKLAIQNNYGDCIEKHYLQKNNLSFAARPRSDDTLNRLFDNDVNIDDNEISRGYVNALDALESYLINDDDYKGICVSQFYEYLCNKVVIFRSVMPRDLDLNLYFERFNSRGEQLEFHEIIKAELMQQLKVGDVDFEYISKFAKIWDACSEFETPVISFFTKQTKSSHPPEERELVFDNRWRKSSWEYNYTFKNVYESMDMKEEATKSLIDVIKDGSSKNNSKNGTPDENQNYRGDENPKYRCLVNYNTFLYYALYLTEGKDVSEIQLDDKKLNQSFASKTRDKNWILRFGVNLLKLKFIFDNLIIRNRFGDDGSRSEVDWFLQKAYRVDSNDKKGKHYYAYTRYDRNSFNKYNKEILMLQSMFAVTFTANKDTRWLYSTLKFLFENADDLNDSAFPKKFYNFLELLSKDFANDRFAVDDHIESDGLRYGKAPVYAFNFTDYVLWKNRKYLAEKYNTVKFERFTFRYRRSVEHWYPQNRDNINRQDPTRKMDDSLLHSFGNLAIISASQNSRFSDDDPMAKLSNWRDILQNQSIKLQMMAEKTKSWREWDNHKSTEIMEFEDRIIEALNDYLGDI